jgi:hypothetical protein
MNSIERETDLLMWAGPAIGALACFLLEYGTQTHTVNR